MSKFEQLVDAGRYGDTERVQQLLDEGVPIDSVDEWGRCALYLACQYERAATASLLMQRGADVNIQLPMDNGGEFPLYWASMKGMTATVQELLDHGAIVDMKTRDGNTALKVACQFGQLETALLLVAHNAWDDAIDDGTFDWAMSTTSREEAQERLLQARRDYKRHQPRIKPARSVD